MKPRRTTPLTEDEIQEISNHLVSAREYYTERAFIAIKRLIASHKILENKIESLEREIDSNRDLENFRN